MEGSFKKTVCARFRTSHRGRFLAIPIRKQNKVWPPVNRRRRRDKKEIAIQRAGFSEGRLEKVPPLVIFYTTEEALLIVRPG